MQIGNGTFGVRSAAGYQFTRRTPQPAGPSNETLRTQLRRVDDEIQDLRAVLRKTRAIRPSSPNRADRKPFSPF